MVQSRSLLDALELNAFKSYFKHLFRQSKSVVKAEVAEFICFAGELILDSLINKRRESASTEQMGQNLKDICTVLNIESTEVCNGVIDLNIVSYFIIVCSKKKLALNIPDIK